jgi:hypothetical protein
VILFAVREPIAIGWKGDVAGGTPPLDGIAVPLDEPNAIARAFQSGHAWLDVADGKATELDRRLWSALGGAPPAQVSVSPVVIGGHPVCLLYAHGRALSGADDALRGLAEAASTAFVRLLRQTLR